MPADASIYSMIRPQQQGPGPLEQYGQVLSLKNMMGQGELHALQLQKARDDMAEEGKIKELFSSAGGKPVSAESVMAISPTRGLAYSKQMTEAELARANLEKTKVDTHGKQIGQLRDQLAGVQDDAGLAALREQTAKVYGPQAAAGIPPSVNDPSFAAWREKTITTADQLVSRLTPKFEKVDIGGKIQMIDMNPVTNPAIKGMDLKKTATIGETETMRHNPVMEGIARGNLGVAQGQLGVSKENLALHQKQAAQAIDPVLQGNLAAARAGGHETGVEGAKAAIALPQVVATAERATKLIDEMIGSKGKTLKPGEKEVGAHPGFETAVGATLTPGLRFVEGTHTADFMRRLDEIKGGAFLQAFESLKGGGQITEIEGKKATDAISRMDKSQSEAEFVRAARDFQEVVRKGVERAKGKAAATPPKTGAAAPGQPASGGIKFLGFEPPS